MLAIFVASFLPILIYHIQEDVFNVTYSPWITYSVSIVGSFILTSLIFSL